MSLAALKHRRRKIAKAHYKERTFNVQVTVKREPVYARGVIYGEKVKKGPAFIAIACVPNRAGGRARGPTRCSRAFASGPTTAVKQALAKLAKSLH